MEVQRNAYGPSETTTHKLRVAGGTSRRVVNDLRDKLRQAPHELEKTVAHAEQGIMDEVHDIEQAAHHALSPQSSPTNTRKKEREGETRGQQDEEDEGWMSDQSASEPSGSGAEREGKPRGKSPKHKSPKGSRKRISIRRGALGQRPKSILHQTQSEDNFRARRPSVNLNDEEDESRNASGAHTPAEREHNEQRGRTSTVRVMAPSGPGTHTPPHARPTHRRIDSIRSAAPSREMSPARSVRFADDLSRVVSPTSPTSPLSPTRPHTPDTGTPLQNSDESNSQSQTETEQQQNDDDSPRSQVRFSLPGPVAKH